MSTAIRLYGTKQTKAAASASRDFVELDESYFELEEAYEISQSRAASEITNVTIEDDRYVELAVILIRSAANCHQLFERDAVRLSETGEVLGHQFWSEPVDTGRHRCVSGEDAAGANGLDGLTEGETGGNQFTDAFKRQETGMALVGVEDLRLQP